MSGTVRTTVVSAFDSLQGKEFYLLYDVQTGYGAHRVSYKQNLWLKFPSELYRPSDRRLSTKLVPTFAGRGYHMVSVKSGSFPGIKWPGRQAD
jgi:hypothetical protein